MPVGSELVRFGVFELDLNTGELRRNGRKLKLQEQPFQVLNLLLDQPGQVVAREKLKESLWSADTFVDFDHSLNAAIAKLRQAVGDSAENPRFIETLARRGYRFIAPVEFVGSSNGNAVQPDIITPNGAHRENGVAGGFTTMTAAVPAKKRISFVVAISAAAVLALLLLVIWSRQAKQPANAELVELTGPDFAVLSGDDATAAQAMLNGARGVISVTANVVPEAMAQVSAAARRGDHAATLQLDEPLRALHEALFLEPNPIPVKWVMSDQGWIERGIRLPLTELSEPLRARVRAALVASRGQLPLARAKSA